MIIEAILFDFDGVLVDTPQLHHRALNEALHHFGLVSIPFGYMGMMSRDKLIKFFPSYENQFDSILAKKNEEYDNLFFYALKNGLKNMLQYFGDYKIGIVSNSRRKYIDQYLFKTKFPLAKISVIIARENTIAPKPSPDPYRMAAEEIGVDPAHILAIEDSDEGAESARLAGCHVMRSEYSKFDAEEILRFAEDIR